MTAQLMAYAIGTLALAALLYKLKVRLQLSRAKHPSLRGHARIGLWTSMIYAAGMIVILFAPRTDANSLQD